MKGRKRLHRSRCMRAFGTMAFSIPRAYAIWLVFTRMWIYCDFFRWVQMTSPTINHIYCPIFHFQLIPVEVIVCVNVRANEWAAHWKLKRNIYRLFVRLRWVFQLDSCAQNVVQFFVSPFERGKHSFCAIVFNKFSASKHKMDPIIKQIHNIHSLTIKGYSNHKNWTELSDQNQPSEHCPNINTEHWTEEAKKSYCSRTK